jgi:hypothetical protein
MGFVLEGYGGSGDCPDCHGSRTLRGERCGCGPGVRHVVDCGHPARPCPTCTRVVAVDVEHQLDAARRRIKELEKHRVADARLIHMLIRKQQAAYAAGLRDGPEECMAWLHNALIGPGNLPNDGADPQWYAEDAWTEGPPWPKPPAANATINEPA